MWGIFSVPDSLLVSCGEYQIPQSHKILNFVFKRGLPSGLYCVP
jgi:hypothetical protein